MTQEPPSDNDNDNDADQTLFEFPCSFPIKAIGRDDGGFESLVIELVTAHVPGLDAGCVTTRPGSKGNYLAVTVTIEATSRAQLDAIYQVLSDHPDVIMAL